MLSSIRQSVARRTEPARVRVRSLIRYRELSLVFSTNKIDPSDIVLTTIVRDDGPRLRHWIDYYTRLGVDHFLVIDNGSRDNTRAILRNIKSVTVYSTARSYGKAHYGVDWMNGLLHHLGLRNWVLWADSDEFLVYDGCATFDLRALTDRLDRARINGLQCLLLDMYSKNRVQDNAVESGDDPFEVCRYYDRAGYRRRKDPRSRTTWIKGGPRGRLFFEGDIDHSPALNKTPLVRWSSRTNFVQSVHRLFPRQINDSSESVGVGGVLLHQKFLASVAAKASDGAHVAEHDPEYRKYLSFNETAPWDQTISHEFSTTKDLIDDGLLTRIQWWDEPA